VIKTGFDQVLQASSTGELSRLEAPVELFIHDRDRKFVDDFDQVLQAEGAQVVLTLYRRPRANAHCERVIKTFRHEALDWLLIFGEQHLDAVLMEYVAHYKPRATTSRPRPPPA
jgi:hypothetical protein